MPDETMYAGLGALAEMGFSVRTEQITALPYGATSSETAINLDADLEILNLNMGLRRATGLPNVAWATTLLPYMGTKMSDYCLKYGFATEEEARNPEQGYHERSVLRHVAEYAGPSLIEKKGMRSVWLSDSAQERYRDQNTSLCYNFHVLAYLSELPDAGRFVARHLREQEELSVAALNADIRKYVTEHKSSVASRLQQKIKSVEKAIVDMPLGDADRRRLLNITSYCAILPGDGTELARRYLRYSNKKEDVGLLSDIIKKYLFDTQLYLTDESTCELYDGAVFSTRDDPNAAGT